VREPSRFNAWTTAATTKDYGRFLVSPHLQALKGFSPRL
jgi:hypothetical protein